MSILALILMFLIWVLAFMLVSVFQVAAEAPWAVIALIVLVFYVGQKDKKKKEKKRDVEQTMVRSLDDVLGPEAVAEAGGNRAFPDGVTQTASLDVFSPDSVVQDELLAEPEHAEKQPVDDVAKTTGTAQKAATDKPSKDKRKTAKQPKQPDLTQGQLADIKAAVATIGIQPEKDASKIFGQALLRALVYLPLSLVIGVFMLSSINMDRLSLINLKANSNTGIVSVLGFAVICLFFVSIEFLRDGEDGQRIPLMTFSLNFFQHVSTFLSRLLLLVAVLALVHFAIWGAASAVSHVFDLIFDLFTSTRGDDASTRSGQPTIDFVYLVTYIIIASKIYPEIIGSLNGEASAKHIDKRIKKAVRKMLSDTHKLVSNLVFGWIIIVYLIVNFTDVTGYLSSALSTVGLNLHPNILQVVLTFQLCVALLAGVSGYAGRRMDAYGKAAQQAVFPSVETASTSSVRPGAEGRSDFDQDPQSRFMVHRAGLDDQAIIKRFLERCYGTVLVKHYDEPTRAAAIPKMSTIGRAMLSSGRFYLLEDRETGALAGVGGWRFRRQNNKDNSGGDGDPNDNPTTAVIRVIEVHPDNANQGAENILLGRIIHEAKAAGITDLVVYTALHGERFFLNNGFNTTRLIDKPMGDDLVFPLLEIHYPLEANSKKAA